MEQNKYRVGTIRDTSSPKSRTHSHTKKKSHQQSTPALTKKEKECKAAAFSAKTAQNYFEQTFQDENRKYTYLPLSDFHHLYDTQLPLKCKIASAKGRGGGGAGFKEITKTHMFLTRKVRHSLMLSENWGHKIWKTRNIPIEWAQAYIILLSRSNELSFVSEFCLIVNF